MVHDLGRAEGVGEFVDRGVTIGERQILLASGEDVIGMLLTEPLGIGQGAKKPGQLEPHGVEPVLAIVEHGEVGAQRLGGLHLALAVLREAALAFPAQDAGNVEGAEGDELN